MEQNLHTTPTAHANLYQFLCHQIFLEILLWHKKLSCKKPCILKFYEIGNLPGPDFWWCHQILLLYPFRKLAFWYTRTLRNFLDELGVSKVDARFIAALAWIRGGVENTRLEAKANNTNTIRGQGQPFRGQTLSKPRTGMLEAKVHGGRRKCSPKQTKKRIFSAMELLRGAFMFKPMPMI